MKQYYFFKFTIMMIFSIFLIGCSPQNANTESKKNNYVNKETIQKGKNNKSALDVGFINEPEHSIETNTNNSNDHSKKEVTYDNNTTKNVKAIRKEKSFKNENAIINVTNIKKKNKIIENVTQEQIKEVNEKKTEKRTEETTEVNISQNKIDSPIHIEQNSFDSNPIDVYNDTATIFLSQNADQVFLNTTKHLSVGENANVKPVYINTDDSPYIQEQYEDIHIIPDKYNTGLSNPSACNIYLNHNVSYPEYNGIELRKLSDGKMTICFGNHKNKHLNGTILFENVDFSKTCYNSFGIGNQGYYEGNGLTLIFKNCKFAAWKVVPFDTETIPIRFKFYNCAFTQIASSNAELHSCYIGGADSDTMQPWENFYCYDTYISDIRHKTEQQGETHLDGLHSFFRVRNLYFENCRWEVPDIRYSVDAGGFSYVLYFEPREGEIPKNVIFNKCYLNGGGYYVISATSATKHENNVRIINPFIGECNHSTTPYYPSKNGGLNAGKSITENPRLHDSLYVSSVWKDENNQLHFTVSNDTHTDRILTIYTNYGKQEFPIKKTYKVKDYKPDSLNFEDFPIDISFILDQENPQYVIFYEGTRQLRFINFTNEPILKSEIDF